MPPFHEFPTGPPQKPHVQTLAGCPMLNGLIVMSGTLPNARDRPVHSAPQETLAVHAAQNKSPEPPSKTTQNPRVNPPAPSKPTKLPPPLMISLSRLWHTYPTTHVQLNKPLHSRPTRTKSRQPDTYQPEASPGLLFSENSNGRDTFRITPMLALLYRRSIPSCRGYFAT